MFAAFLAIHADFRFRCGNVITPSAGNRARVRVSRRGEADAVDVVPGLGLRGATSKAKENNECIFPVGTHLTNMRTSRRSIPQQ